MHSAPLPSSPLSPPRSTERRLLLHRLDQRLRQHLIRVGDTPIALLRHCSDRGLPTPTEALEVALVAALDHGLESGWAEMEAWLARVRGRCACGKPAAGVGAARARCMDCWEEAQADAEADRLAGGAL